MRVFKKGKSFSHLSLWVIAGAFLLLSPLSARGEGILLSYKGQVLEETDEYVILKLRKADIELFHNSAKSGGRKNLVPEGRADSEKPFYLQRDVVNRIKAELKNELKADVRKELHKQGVKMEFGSVEGRMLSRGIGLANCRVKLIRIARASIFKMSEKGLEFETVTDRNGRYVFREIPTGDYQLQWLPHGSDGWIRRLTERPDVTVEKGKTHHAKDVDMRRPVIEG